MRHSVPLVLLTTLVLCLSACKSSSSSSSSPVGSPSPAKSACSDGMDNDSDGLTDFPDDPGCANANDANETDSPVIDQGLTRYDMANSCWVVKANSNGKYIALNDDSYEASATDSSSAERFYLKPTALGSYLFYNNSRQVISAGDGTALSNVATNVVTEDDNAEWSILAVGDATEYPHTPAYHQEPVVERDENGAITYSEVALWHDFVDPEIRSDNFTIGSQALGMNLAIDDNGKLVAVTEDSSPADESFSFEPINDCAQFPEAESNFTGVPYKGTLNDGSVLGHADVHVHISATEFLAGAQWGRPFHKFGIEHALGNCAASHGDDGRGDIVGGVFSTNPDGHETDGWPTFTDWPSRNMLTHEAIYWKWIERAWAGGLRVIVNDLVDNETLCELQRNVIGEPNLDCNSMNNAGRQTGTMYAMENYIDAQYGGPGKGFFQIVHSPEEARKIIAEGKIAVILGIEISNLFDCKLNYNPERLQGPESEPSDQDPASNPESITENHYNCTKESLVAEMERAYSWGVRQLVSIHEFDNAFGGNGIFDGLVLNVGNRENSGGIPSGDMSAIISAFEALSSGDAEALSNLDTAETGTGEWWTTYNCPEEADSSFSGYLWGSTGGSTQTIPDKDPFDQGFESSDLTFINPITGLTCTPSGQHGRSGGSTPCYPVAVTQCNARWMTPMGLFAYQKMMEMGFIIDWDHMELGMKTQLLELGEAQNPVYPFASTHGTFGGTSVDQAKRNLANGGFLYPSNGGSAGYMNNLKETYDLYLEAVPEGSRDDILFGFGYGTDTNGLSAQSSPRSNIAEGHEVSYPFTFFEGAPFDSPQFAIATPVKFEQPRSYDPITDSGRSWEEDIHGNAHYGMLSDFMEEIVKDGSAEDIKHIFNSAEAYLRTWERTVAASSAIQDNGGALLPSTGKPILRRAPNSNPYSAEALGDPTDYCSAIGDAC